MELDIPGGRLECGPNRPLLMGILNCGNDSVADGTLLADTAARVRRGAELVAAGAQIVDVGAISGRTDTPALSEAEEIALVQPVVRALAARGTDAVLSGSGPAGPLPEPAAPMARITVSVDTWRPAVVEAVLEAGASIINDVSGLADPAVASLAARYGAGLVIMHTRAAPKERAFPGYDDPVGDVMSFLSERIEIALQAGVRAEQIILDPGLDYAKTPQESVEVLRRLDELQTFGRPILLAVSRKYFLGMITGRPPERRLPATLAAIQFGLDRGAAILRVHDVADVAEFLSVALALPGEEQVAMQGDERDQGLMWIAPNRA
jgi:dihydropteroate synthase